ncbi:transposase [Candidatus Bathyarchaeota archaeon]|nr:MAG: transposase [Candidatus Bathyarchaeota archaeon]
MKLTLLVKLLPTSEQAKALLETMETFNKACNEIAEVAFQHRTANKFRLQRLVYYSIRHKYGLSAQLTIRAISKVAEAYKQDKKVKPIFRKYGAIVYDQRILSWKGVDRVSILTLKGRQVIPVKYGAYQAGRLNRIRGQADLILRNRVFYLAVVVDIPEPPIYNAKDWVGVDLGIKNIAVDSDGEVWSGGHLNGLRKRHTKLRAKLQSKGTKSAKRLLKKRSGKEARFARNVNHIISKRLVAKAKGTERGIALEDLKGIRSRITVRKPQRRIQHSWNFYQLRQFIIYKAKLAGVPVKIVDPKNTSRTCPNCGFISKANRKGERFHCVNCGFVGSADHVAALNIRGRAAVSQPNVSGSFEHPIVPPQGQARMGS